MKLEKQFHLQQHPKNKILKNKFNKKGQHLHKENYKLLLKEIKKIYINGKTYRVNGLESLILSTW